jgi:glutathione S-transferase
MSDELHRRMTEAATFYMQGVERALETTPFLAGNALTMSDIAFACDLGQFLRERLMINHESNANHPPIAVPLLNQFPRTKAHLLKLGAEPHFARHFGRFLDGLDER